ncbi:hypothetical protein [Bacillus sp. MSP13]|uniref:hypothetical protein n=1 Tax=Bacillus sp. MSP13 TaxID=1071061 RepID=UPI0012E04A5E|nr:hypothetical protein [Bacillus sp. MSP13]
MNQHPYVSEEKRKLVHQLPYSDCPCFDKIVNGITESTYQHENATVLFPTNYNSAIAFNYLELLRTKKIDGFIMTSAPMTGTAIAGVWADHRM